MSWRGCQTFFATLFLMSSVSQGAVEVAFLDSLISAFVSGFDWGKYLFADLHEKSCPFIFKFTCHHKLLPYSCQMWILAYKHVIYTARHSKPGEVSIVDILHVSRMALNRWQSIFLKLLFTSNNFFVQTFFLCFLSPQAYAKRALCYPTSPYQKSLKFLFARDSTATQILT